MESANFETVAVVIPCYNHGRFLPDAIGCLLAQTRVPDEIVVVNDGSTDDTAEVAASYGGAVKLVTQKNAGLAAARNAGIRQTSGGLLLFLDADDALEAAAIERMLAAAAVAPDASVYYGAHRLIDEDGNTTYRADPIPRTPDMFHLLLRGNPWPPHALMVRRAALEAAGLFDGTMNPCEDWDLWLRLAARGCAFEPAEGAVAIYRRYPGSMSRNVDHMLATARVVLTRHAAAHGRCVECRRSVPLGIRALEAYLYYYTVRSDLVAARERGGIVAALGYAARLARRHPRMAWMILSDLPTRGWQRARERQSRNQL